MFMRWHDLLFMHWSFPPEAVRPLIPAKLQLDTFEGRCWIGVVPFHMSKVRARFLPPIPGTSAFPELNVRTYVTAQGKPGVWFFSLDAGSALAVTGARALYSLPYFRARMSIRAGRDGLVYASRRTHRGAPRAEVSATYRQSGHDA